ncbi:MAG: hypothetical protein HQM08_07740 [Candidatus Riflebacteria bacterium]|nr:hypothetical protein [Candidatus Riflebacteria bacterium]
MKIIVVSGSASKIGKTTLVRKIIESLLPAKVESVKLGHGKQKIEKSGTFFHELSEGLKHIEQIVQSQSHDYLVIESNSVYRYLKPDVGIFLFAPFKPEKESASFAKQNSDIVLDSSFDPLLAKLILFERLGNDLILSAIKKQNMFLTNCTKSQTSPLLPNAIES